LHPSGVGKWVPAAAGKAKAGMAHSDCGRTCGCTGKTVRSHTWALLRWCFTTKRRYTFTFTPDSTYRKRRRITTSECRTQYCLTILSVTFWYCI